MKAFAALILLLVGAVHYGGDLLAMAIGYSDQDRASRAIYYVLRSFEGAAQYAVIAFLALLVAELRWQSAPAFGWREEGQHRLQATSSAVLVILACGWGMFEQAQAGACRLAIGIENRSPAAKPLTGLCDDVTGVPMYMLGLAAGAFIAAVIAVKSLGERNA